MRLRYFDGGTGTVLQQMGLAAGECPELWNVSHPEKIVALHQAYLEAGCEIIKTNTFGVNCFKYPKTEGEQSVERLVTAAIEHVKEAQKKSGCSHTKIALDIGPLGRLLEPFGDLPFEEAVSAFSETIAAGKDAGADLILIETMNDAYETKAAVIAAKEQTRLPIFVTNVYDEKAKLMTGASPETMAAILEGFGVAAIGMNCSLGPFKMLDIVPRLAEATNLPIIVNPNAGLPRMEEGQTIYNVNADEFADCMQKIVQEGASYIGGCCGTTPDYMKEMIQRTSQMQTIASVENERTVITSYANVAYPNMDTISSCICTETSEEIKSAIEEGNVDLIVDEAMDAVEDGADIICLNLDDSSGEHQRFLAEAVTEIQSVIREPLWIISDRMEELEAGMRIYNGKAMVGTRTIDQKIIDRLCKLVKKYGGVISYDRLSEEQYEILSKATQSYGIHSKNIFIKSRGNAI